MRHDDLIVFERQYMLLALREVLTAEEVQIMSFIQSLMRDRQREWESGC